MPTCLALLLACSAAGASDDEEASPRVGIWCSFDDASGACVNVYEMRPDNTFTNHMHSPASGERLDYFGIWLEDGDAICFMQRSWARVDLTANETVATGRKGMSTFYCNDVIEVNGDSMTVTHPTTDETFTVRRLDELPGWARP